MSILIELHDCEENNVENNQKKYIFMDKINLQLGIK